jgi:hypothetical protein
MLTLTEIKEHQWLQPHHIQRIEDQVASLIRRGLAGGILLVITFDDVESIHPEALTGGCSVNVLVEEADIARIKASHHALAGECRGGRGLRQGAAGGSEDGLTRAIRRFASSSSVARSPAISSIRSSVQSNNGPGRSSCRTMVSAIA